VAAVGAPGFSLSLSAASATVAPGGSANLMISAAAVGGFNSSDFSYMYRALWSDLFSQSSTISPGGTSSSTLNHFCGLNRPERRLRRPSACPE